jgi:hypothetical protein
MAERRFSGTMNQDPPRSTRSRQLRLVQAEPSLGDPLYISVVVYSTAKPAVPGAGARQEREPAPDPARRARRPTGARGGKW